MKLPEAGVTVRKKHTSYVSIVGLLYKLNFKVRI